ncbi:MAG TPA: GNAT family N-acetyltransferase [Burkholderiaceae bacterium]
MNIEVITASLDDVDDIASLLTELGYAVTADLIRDKLKAFEASEADAVLLARQGAYVVGVVSLHMLELFHATGKLGRITSLVVSSAMRNQGVGSALIDAADRYFIAKGCIRAEVTSGEHRKEAHAFYIQSGYQEDERRFVKRYNT